MYFRVLGPLTVLTQPGGEVVAIAGARQRKILATMLLHVNQPVSTRRLVDTIWPHDPPTTARKQIQNAMGMLKSTLRTATAPLEIARTAENYWLRASSSNVDLLRFQELSKAAQTSQDRSAAIGWLRSAITLWQGDVVEDIDPEGLHGNIAHIEELRVRAIHQYAELSMAAGQDTLTLIADLTQWSRLNPLHEGLHLALARALHRDGRGADAVRCLQAFRRRLADDLVVEPSDDLTRLERSLTAPATPPSSNTAHELIRQAMEALFQAMDLLGSSPNWQRPQPSPQPGQRPSRPLPKNHSGGDCYTYRVRSVLQRII
jgi:DNA-binding SARP family transcriptional activator